MAHKHSEDSPCDCEKLKNAERDTLREGLKQCQEAREAERTAREREALERAEQSDGKLKKLQKQLIAFQLATAVGATVVGQDAVAKIGEKLGFLQGIQQKIMGGGGGGAAPSAPAAPANTDKDKPKDGKGGEKISMGGWKPYRSKEPMTQQAAADKGSGDITKAFKEKPSGDGKGEAAEVSVVVQKPKIPVKALTQTPESLMPEIASAELPADNYAAFLTPSTLPFDVYSTTIALGDNYGFGDYYGMGGGGSVQPISTPSPSTIAVFAVGGIVNTRRRA
jgi:hypothetical protein